MSNLKAEKKLAKEQDRAYADYRKQEILHNIKPKNKAFDFKKFDDSFPRPKKLEKGKTEFGATMSKFLLLRPDGRFATWQGKTARDKKKKMMQPGGEKQGEQDAKPKTGLMQKMASAAAGVTNIKKDDKMVKKPAKEKDYTKAVNKNIAMQADKEDEEIDQKRLKEAYEYCKKEDIEAKNKYSLNAIVESKPFWLIGDPLVPEDEEDAYVDAELLTSWTNNTNNVRTKFFHNVAERGKFFPFGPPGQLVKGEMGVFGNKALVIGNTLQSIIESTADRKGISKERVDKGHKPILKWKQDVHQIEYVMDSQPLQKTAITEATFKMIWKQSAKE